LFNLYVMLKCLSSEYQLYACGKNYSPALTLNQNNHFAKGSHAEDLLGAAKSKLAYQRFYINS
jgi:hypothetical protein